MSYTDEQYQEAKAQLLQHRGEADPISSREINEIIELDNVGSFPKTRQLVRDIMFNEGIPIIGGPSGYYIAETEDEIAEALEMLERRILGTAERKMALHQAAREWDGLEPSDDHDIL